MSWCSIRFEELYSTPSRNGVYKSKEFHGSGAKIVNMGELFSYEFIGQQEMKRLQMSDSELEKAGLVEGDLLFGRRSLVEAGAGKCSIATSLTGPTTFESSLIRVRVKQELIDPRFLYYWFRSRVGRGRVSAIVSGVNVKGIRGSDLKNIAVDYPDLPTQNRIVAVLSAYDDLIENNRRRIALLEQAARLLYREWFVHFRFPGHETAKFVDGLPEGWVTTALGQKAQIVKGKNITKETVNPGSVPVVAGGLKPAYFHDTANVKGPVVTISASGANAGHIAIYFQDIWASDCSYLSATANPDLFFIHQLLLENVARIRAMQKGAAQPHVYPKDLKRMEVTLPASEIIDQFVQVLDPLYGQTQAVEKQNAQLTKARDLLLPRLMDGRIPIKV